MTCFPSAIPVQKRNPFPERGKFLKPLPSLKPLYNHLWLLGFLGQSPSSTQGPGLLPTLPPSFTSHSPFGQDRTYCSPSSAHFLLPSPLQLLILLPGQPISPQSIPYWSFLPQCRHCLWQELLLDFPRSSVPT